MVWGQRFGDMVKEQNKHLFWYFHPLPWQGFMYFVQTNFARSKWVWKQSWLMQLTMTQCKNLHQKFKCAHTMSGFYKIFQVKKLTATLFSTTWSLISAFICINYISISRSIQVIHSKEWTSSPTLWVWGQTTVNFFRSFKPKL